MLSHRPRAFTLIELLVVVTIIVVLLALLAPALDKAVYQAQLTVCAARLKGIGLAVTTYATGNRRGYPYRPTFDLAKTQAFKIKIPADYTWSVGHASDDRPYLRGYLSIRHHLLDPFALQTVDLDKAPSTPLDSTAIAASYSLWYGAQYPKERAMKKLGDRFTYQGRSFNVLASDEDMIRIDTPWLTSSHPDYDGVLTQFAGQDIRQGNYTQTQSAWGASALRGPIDMNFALDDGSVVRQYGVKYDAGKPGNPQQGPITGVPDDMAGNTNGNAWWNNLLQAGR